MNLFQFKIGDYDILSVGALSQSQASQIKEALERPPAPSLNRLTGRAAPVFFHLEQAGPIVLKTYLRGGILGRVNTRTYLDLSKSRSEREMEMLLFARKLGVNAPEPLAWVKKGRFLIQTWLMLKEAVCVEPLSIIAGINEKKALSYTDEIRRQVRLLIQARLHHVDLHPGNVLVRNTGEVFIIDFDKARQVSEKPSLLSRRYEERWRRAVLKHRLPESLGPMFAFDAPWSS